MKHLATAAAPTTAAETETASATHLNELASLFEFEGVAQRRISSWSGNTIAG